MAHLKLEAVLRQVRSWFGQVGENQASDSALLEHFLVTRDEAAFATLVERHGGMVLGVCRRMLGSTPTAEDAFQAVFLVLAQKVGSIRQHHSLASWLHGVARRVSFKARTQEIQRKIHEAKAAAMRSTEISAASAWRDLQEVLDEELERLPEKYRQPLVLCYLEDLTHEESATRLGWPIGTVKSRLAKGRELLRGQLTRRGLTLTVGALASALAAHAASAASPLALMHATTQAALMVGASSTAAGSASTAALALAEGIVPPLAVGSAKWLGLTLLMAGLILGGGVLYHGLVGAEAETVPVKAFKIQDETGLALLNSASDQKTPEVAKPKTNPPLGGEAELEREPAKPKAAELKDERQKILGVWHGVVAYSNGRSNAVEASFTYNFSAKDVSYTTSNRSGGYGLRLDPAKKEIDFTDDKGKTIYRGIYEFRNDNLWIVENSDGNGTRPKTMDPRPITPSDLFRLVVLSRKPAPPAEVNGLRAELTGPVLVTDDAEEFEVVLKLTNVGKTPLRLGTLMGIPGRSPLRGPYEYTCTPDSFGFLPTDDAIAKRIVALEPGKSLNIPHQVSRAWFRNCDWFTIGLGYEAANADFSKKHNTWTGNVQAPPLLVRVVPGRNVLNLHDDNAAFVANAQWLKDVADNEIRTTWFLRGEPSIAMICRANLGKGEVYTAREVHDHATQSGRTRELSHDQTVKLRDLITKLPASTSKVQLKDYLLVTIRDNGKPRTFAYDRLHPPPEIVRLFDLTGAYLGKE